KEEAKKVYLKIRAVYGTQGRAQFFLRKLDGGITVFYNSPLPFEYFKTLSDLFESIETHKKYSEIFVTEESRELIGLALKLEELRTEILEYLIENLDEYGVTDILNKMFLDVGEDADFKRKAVRRLLAEKREFLFECVTRTSAGRFLFDGTGAETGIDFFDRAYLSLITGLLFFAPNELKEGTEKYKREFAYLAECIEDLDQVGTGSEKGGEKITDESGGISDKERARNAMKTAANERAFAAAVYFIVGKKPKSAAASVAKMFDASAAGLKRFVKMLNAEKK
ncbi:MAG: hypothetical protein LBT20_08840, partial [Clostridiales bacterium]|nr:hypothetical protein [Clostridiales bacterium]